VQEDARLQAEAENDEERKMREYRAQLDAERASRLARGTNHAPEKSDKKSEQDAPIVPGVWSSRVVPTTERATRQLACSCNTVVSSCNGQ
jgi:Zn-dependent M16 (insulinase) family peptidase